MRGIFSNNLKKRKTEQLSMLILYAIVIITILLFGAFFIFGYNTPYDENPNFYAPMFTDAVLIFSFLLIIGVIAITIYSVCISLKQRHKSSKGINNIPENKILWATACLLICIMVITFLLGSTSTVMVNGVAFTKVFWLRTVDMFIGTAICLLIIAVISVALGLSGYFRRVKFKTKA